MLIESTSNDRVKEIKKLMTNGRRRRKSGLYIVEGIRMFREIPVESVREIYVSVQADEACKTAAMEKKREAQALGNDISIYETTEQVYKSMSDTETPQGIMATVAMPSYDLNTLLASKESPLLLIIEKLQDPGNLGTIIRTSEGAGVTAIILSNDCVDIYNPKTIRSTMGSVFRLPIYVASDLRADIDRIKARGVTIYGTHLSGGEFYGYDYTKPSAFLIGNEGNGLSEEISSTADRLIRIPMKGKVESLNAAISAAVVCYEVLRQRL